MEENKDIEKKGKISYLRSKYEPKRQEAGEDLVNAGMDPSSSEYKKARARVAKKYVEKEQEGEIDQLTGVLNRKGTERRIKEQAALSGRTFSRFLIFFFDVNGLKEINDSPFGHKAGDALLKATAKVLTSQERAGDIVGRWGGDEFVVLLPSADLVDVADYWKRKNQEFTSFKDPEHGIDSIWISAGVAQGDPGNVEGSIVLADKAMYKAKRMSKESESEKVNILLTENDLTLDERHG